MPRLLECVPNFSEGRDRCCIDEIVRRIDAVSGIFVLDVDMGYSANRTVVTFAGEPDAVLEGAFAGMSAACELIDLRTHRGAHWRQGATDVCPLVPLSGVTMRGCVSLAHALGQRVARELGLPVYFYGEAAASAARRELSRIRRGGYEGLKRRFQQRRCLPDLGQAKFDPRSGVTAIGARGLLIAYNVNLDCCDVGLAREIARHVRERGTRLRPGEGRPRRDAAGGLQRVAGLPGCRANGWLVEEYGCAQVTCNVTDYRATGLHHVFERVDALARDRGSCATGSEIVGLVPEEALVAAGRHFLARRPGAKPEKVTPELLDAAIGRLGLSSVRPFEIEQKVLERRLEAVGVTA